MRGTYQTLATAERYSRILLIYDSALVTDLENTDHRPQTSKTQTSQFKTSLKTYTFDENSLRMALIFPIVCGYRRADFAFFLVV